MKGKTCRFKSTEMLKIGIEIRITSYCSAWKQR